jgi:mRNA-degrading endonuclease RelE of RelBE toxin-antitoxin system
MRVEFSKEFEKAVRKLSGKMLDSVRQAVQEVINAGNIEELTDCKKLVDKNGQPYWEYMENYMRNIENQQIFNYFKTLGLIK